MTSPQQQMLLHTSLVAAKYGVAEERIDELKSTLSRKTLDRVLYSSGWLSGRLSTIAELHHAECDRVECRTCAELREALAMIVAFVRMDIDADVRAIYGRSVRGWWRRRQS